MSIDIKRHYGLCKNKKYEIITTFGYKIESGADLFEEALKCTIIHSNHHYIGMLGVRDSNGIYS